MSRFAVIDLSQLPPPTVVEVIDFEALLVEVVADYQARNPEFSAATLESDPVVKALEVAAYREMVLRQRVNDAARQRMLPFATGSNLDHMAADIGVQRLVIDPGDPDAVPPVAATYESDANLRLRTQLAPEALTTAGPEGAYIFNGLTAGETPTVIDVDAPTPGVVTLTYTFDPGGISVGIKNVSVQICATAGRRRHGARGNDQKLCAGGDAHDLRGSGCERRRNCRRGLDADRCRRTACSG